MTKQELLDTLEKRYSYYEEHPKLSLIIKLVKGTDESDPDFSLALEHETTIQIIDLFLDCYTEKDLLEWLAKHDFDLFVDYRYSDYSEYDEYDNEEELEEAKENALFYNDDTKIIVHSW